MPTPETVGEFVILEFKRMSDVTDQYVTGKKCSGGPICVHKVGTRTNTWPPRMVNESEKLHSRSKISKRAGPTRKPSLFQGPASRHRVHHSRSMLAFKTFERICKCPERYVQYEI
jgi:hypothetical protein